MRDLAIVVRGRRTDLGISQAELASRVGVSRAWINAIEAAKPTAEFDLILRLVDSLGLQLNLTKPGNLGDLFKGRSVDLDSVLDEYRDL